MSIRNEHFYFFFPPYRAVFRFRAESTIFLSRMDLGVTSTTSSSRTKLRARSRVMALMGEQTTASSLPDARTLESFFSLLKTELVHHERYPTRTIARTSIFEYIESFYNRQRIHGAISYMTPISFERQWRRTTSLTKREPELAPSMALTLPLSTVH